jgi:hypothetical protein
MVSLTLMKAKAIASTAVFEDCEDCDMILAGQLPDQE